MKKFVKIIAVCFILALSVGSYVYVHTDIVQSREFSMNQTTVEVTDYDLNETQSQKLLPETRIIEFLAEKVSDLFASVVRDN